MTDILTDPTGRFRQRFSMRYIDRPFWILFVILIFVAIIALFSAGSTLAYKAGASSVSPILGQISFILIGIVLTFFIQFIPTWMIRFGGYLCLAITLLMLYSMLIPGNPFVKTINGAGRWFNLFGITFQPSELAKLSLTIVVADLLTRIKSTDDARRYFYWTLGLTVVTIFPILLGNLSTALLMAGVVVLMWFLARLPWKYILSTITIAALLMVVGYLIVEFGFIRQHRSIESGPFKRAITWVGRVDDLFEEKQQNADEFRLTDDNYQRSIAKVAVARGGKSPFGVLPGNSKERDYLPLAFADYIFAIIVEETGVIGAGFLIFLYLAILFRACYASSRYADYQAMLMVMGLALMLTCQALISMGVAVGIGPVTGQPLPMISKGGTSVIITSFYFGIMMAVAREQNELRDRQQVIIDGSYNDTPDFELES